MAILQAASGSPELLTEAMLQRFAERAPNYDRENRFFKEDFEEIQRTKYLKMAVPRELGGLGMNLVQVIEQQGRLAYYAHADALALNMHIYWTGVAADLWRAGDKSLEWLLNEAADGAIFAAGHAEPGNDLPLLYSTTTAERVEGGYRFKGRKHFGSLTPVWNWLGLHGQDSSDPANPRIVHVFMPRESTGARVVEVWNALGMRATASEDTVLDNVFIPDRFIARVVPAGFKGVDLFVLGIFAWGLLGFATVYRGLARKVIDLTVEKLKSKKSLALSRSMACHPEVQHSVAQMILEMEAADAQLDRVAADWSNGVDHGPLWGMKIVAAKWRAVESAWKIVDRAFDLGGGFAVFQAAGLERYLRDARLGRIHPANSFLTHELVAKTALGLDPDERPRWG